MRPTPPFILPAHLRDDAPHKTCNLCGRKSWSREEWLTMCNMPQPNGERRAPIRNS
jgi:hypothetical protein